MVGYTLLILSIYSFNLLSPCSLQKNMSSMHFHHKYGLHSDSYIISSSSSAINKMLYESANLVPIAVPIFITFWDFLMFYQIFLSPQAKQSKVISNKDRIYELPNELRNDIRLMILKTLKKSGKAQNWLEL